VGVPASSAVREKCLMGITYGRSGCVMYQKGETPTQDVPGGIAANVLAFPKTSFRKKQECRLRPIAFKIKGSGFSHQNRTRAIPGEHTSPNKHKKKPKKKKKKKKKKQKNQIGRGKKKVPLKSAEQRKKKKS